MSKFLLLAIFLLAAVSVPVILFLFNFPRTINSFQIFPSRSWDQTENSREKHSFHPDCPCFRCPPEYNIASGVHQNIILLQVSEYKARCAVHVSSHFRTIPPLLGASEPVKISANTVAGSNVGV